MWLREIGVHNIQRRWPDRLTTNDRADQMITQRAGADDQTTRVGADQMINDRANQMELPRIK